MQYTLANIQPAHDDATLGSGRPRITSPDGRSTQAVRSRRFLLTLACLAAFGLHDAQGASPKLLPFPTTIASTAGSMALGPNSRIVVDDSSLGDAGGVLSNEIYAITGQRLPVYRGAARNGDVVLRLNPAISGDGYTYAVGEQAVVSANSYKNLALASTTVVQSLTRSATTWTLPKVQIADAPEASFRSTMLDLARNPHSINSIKQQISLNRLYKIPYMQLHLTDDQAFTFACNSVSGINGHGSNPATYSQRDLKDLVHWADQRGVTLIPEMDVPGHSAQLVANRPDLFNTGTANLANIANPTAVTALKGIVGEMAGVFSSSPYIHIGGDEANYAHLTYKGTTPLPAGVRRQWDSKMESLNSYTPEAVFRDFANGMNDYIQSLGKKTMVWESSSILNTSVPLDKDILVMPYENTFTSTPSNYINAGFKVVNASWSPLYIVGFNGSNTGMADTLTDIYNWDKTWFDVYYGWQSSTSAKHVAANTDAILGAQMCLWENSESGELAADRQRVAAMAERLWNPNSGLTYADFLTRLTATDALLDGMIVADRMALPTTVPEPGALTLLGIALGLLAAFATLRHRRARRRSPSPVFAVPTVRPRRVTQSLLRNDASHPHRPIRASMALLVMALLVVAMLGVQPAAAGEPAVPVIPAPVHCQVHPGKMAITPKSQIVVSHSELLPLAKALAGEIQCLAGVQLATAQKPPSPGDIFLKIDPSLREEAYAIEIDTVATVQAGNAAAVAQATTTLLQSLENSQTGVQWPRMSVQDQPFVPYRGLMVDCARNWHSPQTLKQLVVLCRWYKIRYLHLHLTDDQSFTFPSRAFPALWAKCPHYSIQELRDLESFATHRGVTLIPELDVPGHATSLVQAMPILFGTRPAPVGNEPWQAICVGRETTYRALDTLVGEMCDVFRATPYFHIGGDEVDHRFWNRCADTRDYMAAHKIADMEELYRHFLVRMHEIVKRHGKKTLVWEGFAKAGNTEIPRDVTVMAFESKYNLPPDLLAGGYKVINAAWQPLYVTPGPRWSPEHIYGWNHYRWESCWDVSAAFKTPIVVPPTSDVIGAQICSWEQGEGAELPSLRDRSPAMSERIWNPSAGRSFADFSARFKTADGKLEKLLKQK